MVIQSPTANAPAALGEMLCRSYKNRIFSDCCHLLSLSEPGANDSATMGPRLSCVDFILLHSGVFVLTAADRRGAEAPLSSVAFFLDWRCK